MFCVGVVWESILHAWKMENVKFEKIDANNEEIVENNKVATWEIRLDFWHKQVLKLYLLGRQPCMAAVTNTQFPKRPFSIFFFRIGRDWLAPIASVQIYF